MEASCHAQLTVAIVSSGKKGKQRKTKLGPLLECLIYVKVFYLVNTITSKFVKGMQHNSLKQSTIHNSSKPLAMSMHHTPAFHNFEHLDSPNPGSSVSNKHRSEPKLYLPSYFIR